MPSPLPLPIRVLVKGSSNVVIISPMGGPRTDFTFPRVLEQRLLADGRPAEVRSPSVPGELTKHMLRTWEEDMLGYSPDVVILLYGQVETVHLFLPWRLERHANSFRTRPGTIRDLYRNRVLRPVWKALAKLQSKADRTVNPTLRRGRPRRVAADLARLLEHIRFVQNPLVLVFELQVPAERFRRWFPGMTPRIEAMNAAIKSVVEKLDDPNVRWFTTSDLVESHAGGDIDVATPDGFHFTPAMHRAIGEKLADVIEEWCDTQPHLKVGS
jgi:GDSL-like Lipase/Acylhydrolase family